MHIEEHADRPDPEFFAEQFALIPPRYSPVAHLLATSSVGVVALVAGFMRIADFRWSLLAFAAATFVFSNLVEWLAHKYLLHRRQRFLEILYDQHVPRHHVFYRDGAMSVVSRKEWYFVLMPARGVLALALTTIPMAVALARLCGPDIGWTFIMTAGSYATIYELTHLTYHLPEDHFLQRIGIVRWLSRHHARHHDPALMRKWNFNITVPLWDFLLGTNCPRAKPPTEP